MKFVEIPMPEEVLKGDWGGIVYAIETLREPAAMHEANINNALCMIYANFCQNNHESVSLREVRRELVYSNDEFCNYLTLVQFRVRDSY